VKEKSGWKTTDRLCILFESIPFKKRKQTTKSNEEASGGQEGGRQAAGGRGRKEGVISLSLSRWLPADSGCRLVDGSLDRLHGVCLPACLCWMGG